MSSIPGGVVCTATETRQATEPALVRLEEREEAGEPVCWTKAWYPVLSVAHMEARKPHPVEILGKRLVVWETSEGEYGAADDACPHKLAPLSMGKVQGDGSLMCRYHGWCFNGSGKCTKLPMATSPNMEQKLCQTGRSAVAAYPTKVHQGLLWVWPEAGPDSSAESERRPPSTSVLFDAAEPSTFRNKVDFMSFVENAYDPCHANFLHEGLGFGAGYSPKTAVPMLDFKVDGDITAEGFTLRHGGYSKPTTGMLATRTFSPPCTVRTDYLNPSGLSIKSQLHFVPICPGETRVFFAMKAAPLSADEQKKLEAASSPTAAGGGDQAAASPPKPKRPAGASLLPLLFALRKLQVMLSSVLLPRFLREGLQHRRAIGGLLPDQDALIMAGAEAALKRVHESSVAFNEAYYLPTPSDQGVVAFRKWANTFAGGGPFGAFGPASLPPQAASSAELLDRWHCHTKDCSSCKRSLSFLAAAASWCTRAGVALCAASLALLAGAHRGMPLQASVGCLAAGVLLYALSRFLQTQQHSWISGMRPVGHGLPERELWKD